MIHELDGLPEEERPGRARERKAYLGLGDRGRWIAVGVFLALLIALVGGFLFTQTDRGRAQVLKYTLGALGGRLSGELEIARIEGNIFTGARAYELRLADLEGVPMAIVDSAYIRYRAATFVGGDIVIDRLVLHGARIDLVQMPGDTLWNYQRILQDPTPGPAADRVGATLIAALELNDADISIRSPVQPDIRLSPERQQLEFEEMLADTARWVIDEVPGGYLRTMTIDARHAAVAELFISSDERGGIYLELKDADADVRLWRDPPLEIRGAQASLNLREGVVNFEAGGFSLPGSRGQGVGRIDLRGERPMYDVALTMPEFTLADIRWLYPWLPNEPGAGSGSVRIWLEDRPDELLFIARDLVLDLPGTRVTGQVGLLTGDVLRFVDVDLEADPLDVDSVERLLPEGLPVDGLEISGAVIRGEG